MEWFNSATVYIALLSLLFIVLLIVKECALSKLRHRSKKS